MVEQLSLPVPKDDQDDAAPTPEERVPRVVAPVGMGPNSSLRSAMGAFKVYMEQQGFAENTKKAFLSDINILIQFLGVGISIGAVSTSNLNQFVHWLVHDRGVPCNPKSLARRVTTLKVFFGWLVETGILTDDPAAPVIHKPVMTPLPTILSDVDIERVLGVAQAMRHAERPDARPYLLAGLLLHTGIKKGECMNIVMNHLDLGDPAQPILWIRYANPRRRHKERKLRLPIWWPAVLAEYRTQYQPQEALFSCTARNLEYVLAKLAEQADLAGGVSFEMLRWTCAVHDYKAGMEADKLRQKLGVSKITWREMKVKVARLAEPAL